ncbi:hypothetical protein RRG08_037625 [Elysia crispata]|uniref:Uncharacterized protein n=1 Tax=Elysia crispata TaxID=231223 RepID=A0AAE1CYI6_9GAST|nr:hypothetical protein RRG08_037625 [Elysia crispata]
MLSLGWFEVTVVGGEAVDVDGDAAYADGDDDYSSYEECDVVSRVLTLLMIILMEMVVIVGVAMRMGREIEWLETVVTNNKPTDQRFGEFREEKSRHGACPYHSGDSTIALGGEGFGIIGGKTRVQRSVRLVALLLCSVDGKNKMRNLGIVHVRTTVVTPPSRWVGRVLELLAGKQRCRGSVRLVALLLCSVDGKNKMRNLETQDAFLGESSGKNLQGIFFFLY